MDVTAVIPNWNGGKLLPSILHDLAVQAVQVKEVIVVDNGSTDDSLQCASAAGARVVALGVNLGFAAAVNRGVAAANSEFVAVLNNDVSLRPDWLEQISSAFHVPAVMFAAGKLLNASHPNTIDGTYDAVCRGGTAWRCGAGRPDGPEWAVPKAIFFAPFTAVVLRRLWFAEMGGLNEAFGSYLEDVEFGLRCASKGYTGRYVPQAVGFHIGSATFGRWNARTVRYIARNQVLLLAVHYPRELLWRYGWPIATAQCLWGLVALRNGAGLAWLTGKYDGLRLWASVRGRGDLNLASVLGSSEKVIRDLQRESGYDLYWRLYFALT